MKYLSELFDDTKDDKKTSRKSKIIKDTIKDAAKNKISGKKDVYDPDPDLTGSEAVK